MKPAAMTLGLLLVFTPLRAMDPGDTGLRQLLAAERSPEDVEIHVCGEYARWKRPGSADFLDFVDVSASGSAQLADYARLGFAQVELEAPHGIN